MFRFRLLALPVRKVHEYNADQQAYQRYNRKNRLPDDRESDRSHNAERTQREPG